MISSFHRPTVARVNLQAIKENVASVQEHIPLGVKTYAVVKADAYGHGAVQVQKHFSLKWMGTVCQILMRPCNYVKQVLVKRF